MTTPAGNGDPSLHCVYIGGPRDGFRTGDLPLVMSGKKLTGMETRIPLSQPHEYSLFAVYLCTSEAQIDGFWQFHFQSLTGPNGEQLIGEEHPERPSPMSPRFRQLCVQSLRKPGEEVALLTDNQLRELVRAEYARYVGSDSLSDADLEMALETNL